MTRYQIVRGGAPFGPAWAWMTEAVLYAFTCGVWDFEVALVRGD